MFFKKQDRTVLDVFEDELKRQHAMTRTISSSYEAQKHLAMMVKTLCDLVARVGDEKLEKRLKSMEESIGDLYLTGKGDSTRN